MTPETSYASVWIAALSLSCRMYGVLRGLCKLPLYAIPIRYTVRLVHSWSESTCYGLTSPSAKCHVSTVPLASNGTAPCHTTSAQRHCIHMGLSSAMPTVTTIIAQHLFMPGGRVCNSLRQESNAKKRKEKKRQSRNVAPSTCIEDALVVAEALLTTAALNTQKYHERGAGLNP